MATTKLGLPTIAGNQNADVVRDLNALADAVDGKAGVADGLATLGADGKVPAEQLNVEPPKDASTSQKGIVQLNDTTTSTSTSQAATANAVKTSYDKAVSVDSALTSHKNDDTAHGIGEKATLLTTEKTSIVGAVNELFTDVSNGKALVGTAITDVDPMVTVPTEPTFQDLATAIGEFAGRKKWASGTFTRSGTASQTISGLDFTPRVIVFQATGEETYSGMRGLGVYAYSGFGNPAPDINKYMAFNSTTVGGIVTIGSNQFTIALNTYDQSVTIEWIAFE